MVAFIAVVGTVARAAPFRTSTQSGFEFSVVVTDASVRYDGSRRDDTRTYYRCVCFDDLAARAARIALPGSVIAVIGRLCPYEWKDRDHRKRVSFELVAGDLVALEREARDD